tara:strand:+ start:38 stop:1351 length:1314 start_codon:yes stop_codon:yes gene_type:complete
MAKNILKEAIADAKAVREVALANAKAALEEAFTPKLQSMLSAKLSEDLNEEMDEDDKMEEMYYDEDEADEDMKEMSYDEDEADEDMKESDLDEEIDLEEILNELELEEGEEATETVDEAKEDDLDEAKKDDDKDDMKEATDEDLNEADEDIDEAVGYPNHRADQVQKVKHDASDINQGLNEGENFDLDALLEEINNLDEKEDKDDVKEGEDITENGDDDDDYWKKVSSGGGGYGHFEEGEDTNEVVGTAAAIGGIIAAAGGLSALETAAEDPEFANKYPKVAKALAMMQKLGGQAGAAKRMEEEAKDKELEETKAALEAVTTELNEVNLLNSKLLYVNRIFKANNLDEGQKLRVVETLDNATNVKEAKLIYETIKDTFTVANNKKESFKNRTKSLKEGIGMASKAAGTSTAPKKEVISESNDMMKRFQKLANITINE